MRTQKWVLDSNVTVRVRFWGTMYNICHELKTLTVHHSFFTNFTTYIYPHITQKFKYKFTCTVSSQKNKISRCDCLSFCVYSSKIIIKKNWKIIIKIITAYLEVPAEPLVPTHFTVIQIMEKHSKETSGSVISAFIFYSNILFSPAFTPFVAWSDPRQTSDQACFLAAAADTPCISLQCRLVGFLHHRLDQVLASQWCRETVHWLRLAIVL